MPRIRGPRKIGRYGDEFKVQAVRLTFVDGTQVQQVASALDIHPFMLSRWRKQYGEGKFMADRRVSRVIEDAGRARDERIRALEQALAKLRMENDLLTKAIRFSSDARPKCSRS